MISSDGSAYSRKNLGAALSRTEADLYRDRAYVEGSRRLRNAILCAREGRPFTPSDGLLWNSGFSKATMQTNGKTAPWKETSQRQYDQIIARDQAAEALRVNRDPCPRCNVRADIGCKHRRAG